MSEHDSATTADLILSRRKLLLAAAGIAPAALLTQAGYASAVFGAAPDSGGTSQFAPVPERARPPQFPSKEYLLDDLGGGVFGVRGVGNYQSMFLVTRRGVVAVDAPANFGDTLLAAIGEVTDKPVTHFVYSHAHVDHTGGAHRFPPNARYVAHELTAEMLRKAADPRRPLPTQTFAGQRHVLHVGGERLILEYRGNNHLAGNLFIHAPDQRVLMLVDVITPRWAPFFRLGLSANVPAYTDATNQVLGYDFTTLITGHAGHFGTRADVEEHGRYLADLQAATGQALGTVDFAAAVKDVSPDNYQAQAKVWTGAVVKRAAELMPSSWLTQLGGADVFLPDNALAMLWSMLID